MCPLCRQPAERQEWPNADAATFSCPRCGRFALAGSEERFFRGSLSTEDQVLLPYLSIYTRQVSDNAGGRMPLFNDPGGWREDARAQQHMPIGSKIRKFLAMIESRSPHPGAVAPWNPANDYPAVGAVNREEMEFLWTHAMARGYLVTAGMGGLSLTVKGWEELDPAPGGGVPGRCFVAMSCDPVLDEAYNEGILRAVKTDCHCDPVLVEKTEHNDKICDRVLAEIQRAQFVVADVTLHRQNVYFEAGFAMGLGRPVIWTCRADEFTKDKSHFDTRQYAHVIWEDPAELRRKLADRIRVTILSGKSGGTTN